MVTTRYVVPNRLVDRQRVSRQGMLSSTRVQPAQSRDSRHCHRQSTSNPMPPHDAQSELNCRLANRQLVASLSVGTPLRCSRSSWARRHVLHWPPWKKGERREEKQEEEEHKGGGREGGEGQRRKLIQSPHWRWGNKQELFLATVRQE